MCYSHLTEEVHIVEGRGGVRTEGDLTGNTVPRLNITSQRLNTHHLTRSKYTVMNHTVHVV